MRLFFLTIGLLLFVHGESWAKPLKIGVLAKRGVDMAHQKWDATATYLSKQIQGEKFIIVPLGFEEINSAVVQKRVDFLLVNPSIYVELEIQYGVNRLATLKNKGPVGAHTVFGGVIITKADRNDIQTLKDLKKGYRFMAVKETSLGGFQLAWSELKKVGIDPYKDFTELLFRSKHDLVVYAVHNGEVDAGTVRTDTLERMSEEGNINLDDFKIIGSKALDDVVNFPYSLSTILVPEWPFAKLAHIKESLAQKVAIALMEMSAESEAAISGKNEGWTIPLNYQPIRNLLIDLKIGPFRQYGQLTLTKVVNQYWPTILISIIVLLFLLTAFYYIIKTNRKLSQSQKKLSQEVEERLHIEKRLYESHGELQQKVEQYQATLERLGRIEKYYELTSLLVSCTKPKELLQKAVDQIVETSGSLVGVVYSYNDETKMLEPSVFHGIDGLGLKNTNIMSSLLGKALTDRMVKHLCEIPEEAKIKVNIGLSEISCQEVLILPLYTKDIPLGTIVLGSLSHFPVEDLPFFNHMADQVSILLDKVLVVEKLDNKQHLLVNEKQEKDQLLKKMKHMATYDELTQLPNRRLVYDILLKLLQKANRDGHKTAVLFMDLDGFKQINDTYGHAIGDRVLVDVAGILTKCLRESDIVGRMGGDEFVAVLDDVGSAENTEKIMEKIIQQIPLLAKRIGKEKSFGISIGALICDSEELDPDELIKQADDLMYKAKAAGKGRFYIKDLSI